MKVIVKNHWRNHEPLKVYATKKEALEEIKLAWNNSFTNHSNYTEWLEEANVTKLNL
jgi:hypothetical protein